MGTQSFRREQVCDLVPGSDSVASRDQFSNSSGPRAPAYDLVPSLTSPGLGTHFFLAMSVGGHGREASLGNALSRAGPFGLTGPEAQNIIDPMAVTVSGWREHFASAGCPETELRALETSFTVPENLT